MNVQLGMSATQHRNAVILSIVAQILQMRTAPVRRPARMVVMNRAPMACSAMPRHLATIRHLPSLSWMLAHTSVEETTPMLLPLVLLNAPVVQAPNVLASAPSIRALRTHRVTTQTHTIVVLLGATQHRTACFPVQVGMTTIALITRIASRIRRATRMIPSCVEQALKMPHLVSGLVRQELVANALLESHASPTQRVEHH